MHDKIIEKKNAKKMRSDFINLNVDFAIVYLDKKLFPTSEDTEKSIDFL